MNENLYDRYETIADVISGSVLILAVGGFVLLGIWLAVKNKRSRKIIRFVKNGFIYYGPDGTASIRWRDITSAEVIRKSETSYDMGSDWGKELDFLALDISAGNISISIPAGKFTRDRFDDFISIFEQKASEGNSRFSGIRGDIKKFRESIPTLKDEMDSGDEE